MSEEVALANANAADLAAARSTIDGQRRLIERLKADNAALLGVAKRAHQMLPYDVAMADVALLKAEHPGAQLLAENTELRGALDVALAELERSRPHLFALARLIGRCDMAFEIILQATSAPAAHRTARRMRAELAPKEPEKARAE